MGWTILHHALAAAWPILISVVIVAWSQARAGAQDGFGRASGQVARMRAVARRLRRWI